jgi:nucleotide-binding universal stress UspA family protein
MAGNFSTLAASERVWDTFWMAGFQRILCPVDFSETSRRAFEHAVWCARTFGAELTVLHVLEPAPLTVAYDGMPDVDFHAEAQRIARQELEKLLATADLSGVRATTRILHGATYKAIAEFAAIQPADLIVIGTHGRSGLEYAFFGSTAERVMRSVSCPVLVVPRPRKPAEGKAPS